MIDFIAEPLTNGATLSALAEITVLGIVSGAIGCWIVLYELSYSAESLAHGLFPGLVTAALIGGPAAARWSGRRNRRRGADRGRHPLLGGRTDASITVVITTLFGAGVLLALSPSSPPGIRALLFGDLLGVTFTDVAVAAAIGAVSSHRPLDPPPPPAGGRLRPRIECGRSGCLLRRAGFILLALVSATILVAVQGLGTLLVAAILVGPAAAARLVTRRIGPMMTVSVAVAVLSGFVGIYASFHLRTAAGASVVVAIAVFYLLAALFSRLGSAARPSPARPLAR